MTTMAASHKQIRRSALTNNRGIATIEAIPLLVLFVMLMGYSLGMFGMVHTSILHSIAARTYAFETFRNRTDLTYFRENATQSNFFTNKKLEVRLHGINSEQADNRSSDFVATTRPLAIGYSSPAVETNESTHATNIFSLEKRNQSVGVSPGWVMVGYGICLNARCGDR